jgi:uncharacterized protein (DUF305 family)
MNRTLPVHRALLTSTAALVTLALAAGCGGGDDSGGTSHGGASQPAASASAAATFNDTDVMFAQMMIVHHKQAVEMATLAETRAADAEVKQVAGQVKAAQDPEITTMTGWLTTWGKPTAAGGMSHGSMPGEMSDADMTKLAAAKGAEFDRMFAEMMVAHHNGAIQMAKDEQQDGANPDAKALAVTIEQTQAAEVVKLQAVVDRL